MTINNEYNGSSNLSSSQHFKKHYTKTPISGNLSDVLVGGKEQPPKVMNATNFQNSGNAHHGRHYSIENP